jgi:ketosteroid isomerase-like protein
MKKRTLFGLVFLVVTSCGSNNAGDSAHAFADKFIAAENKAWSTGVVDDLKALEDSNVIYHLPGLEVTGWKVHEDYIVQGRTKVANLKQNWKYLSGEGSHFALAYDSTATLLGEGKTPPSDVANHYLFFFRLKDGRIAEVWANGSTTSAELKKQ